MYEGSNRIEFSYRPEAGSVSNNYPYSAGRAGLPHYYNNSSGGTPNLLSDLGAAPTVSNGSGGFFTNPASGQQYSFVLVPNAIPPCIAPTVANLTRLGRASVRVQWAIGPSQQGATARVHYGPAGFVLGSPADQIAPGTPADSAQLTGLLSATDYEYLLELDCGTGTPPGLSSRARFRTYTPASNDEGSRAIWVGVLNALRPARLTAGSVYDASPSLPANPIVAQPPGSVYDVWYAFRAIGPTLQLTLDADGQLGTFVVEVRNGYNPGSQSIACGVSPASLLLSNLTAGQAYFIRIYPLTSYSSFQFGIVGSSPAVPANNDCSAAQRLTVAPAPGGVSPCRARCAALRPVGWGSLALAPAPSARALIRRMCSTSLWPRARRPRCSCARLFGREWRY